MALAAGTKLGPYEILQPELICSQFILNHVSEAEVMSRMTRIEVVDSAVKIGLRACIAGLSSYLTNKTTLERAKNAEYTKRRRDLLERLSIF